MCAKVQLKVAGETKIQEIKTHVEVVDEKSADSDGKELQASDEAIEDLPMKSERKKEMKEELEERSKE